MRIRPLYQDERTIVPHAKIFLVSNFKPEFNGQDQAMKDRIVFIPFKRRFEKTPENTKKVNGMLKNHLDHFFSLMVDHGAQWWNDGDLTPPAVCQEATESYHNEQDDLTTWLSEEVLLEPTEEQLKLQQAKTAKILNKQLDKQRKGLLLTLMLQQYNNYTRNNPMAKGDFEIALGLRQYTIVKQENKEYVKRSNKHVALKEYCEVEDVSPSSDSSGSCADRPSKMIRLEQQ